MICILPKIVIADFLVDSLQNNIHRLAKERIAIKPWLKKNSFLDTFLYRKPLFNNHLGESI
jgi:hypothetical protein